MNDLITFIQEVRVIQKQCFVGCVRQCLCSHVRQAAAPVPRPPRTCGDVTLADHRMVAASQPALLFLGQMAGRGVDTPCFRKSQILALCSMLTEEGAQLVFDLHAQKQTPPATSLGTLGSAPRRPGFPTLPRH